MYIYIYICIWIDKYTDREVYRCEADEVECDHCLADCGSVRPLPCEEIGFSLPNNQSQRRACYALCHMLYPVLAAHTSISWVDSNTTSYSPPVQSVPGSKLVGLARLWNPQNPKR